jgi:hypothetical protein
VATFHQDMIANVAIMKPRNIVHQSHIRKFFLSNSQTMTTIGRAIASSNNTNSEFSFERKDVSVLYNLTVKIVIISIATKDNPVVIQGMASLQLMALKTSTYHMIVKNRGTRYIL